MDVNAAYLFKGWIGGFVAVYAIYYILSRFVFNKLEVVKAFRISLVVSFVLLLAVSDYTFLESFLFYTPAIINVYFIETLIHNRKTCPSCNGRVKKSSVKCRHCGWDLVKQN